MGKEDFVITDFILLQKMKQGDEKAFDTFVHKYYDDILKYCNYHCRDTGYAEDLAQETFLNFFAKLSDYHFKGKTKNYLYTIAGNLCKNFYKKKIDIPVEDEELDRVTGVNEMGEVLDKIMIETAVESLPEEMREIIILYYFQELKLSEIASVLQIGLSLVKYRLTQARKQLEKFIREEADYEVRRKNSGV